MKELDILLERFIELNYQSLSDGDWPELESLLKTEDDVLWDWLQDTNAQAAASYRGVLNQIRHAGG